jgi:hypothetical protein
VHSGAQPLFKVCGSNHGRVFLQQRELLIGASADVGGQGVLCQHTRKFFIYYNLPDAEFVRRISPSGEQGVKSFAYRYL